MSATKQTLATIERFTESYNRKYIEAVMRLMTEDIVFENSSGGRFEGKEAVRAVLTRAFKLMSTGWFDTEDMYTAGDRCVVLWTYIFIKKQPEHGQVRGVDIFLVRDGLVAEKFSYVKSEEFVRKLGLQLLHM